MTKQELKSKFPETYNAIVQEGVMQERQRKETIKEMENEKAKNESFNFKLN